MTKELLEKIKELEGKLGQGWIKEFESITSAEALREKLADHDIQLTETVAEEAFNLLTNDETEELSEAELSAVAGGYFGC
jgi:hypothetical protein